VGVGVGGHSCITVGIVMRGNTGVRIDIADELLETVVLVPVVVGVVVRLVKLVVLLLVALVAGTLILTGVGVGVV
jgi:hypothetical protein